MGHRSDRFKIRATDAAEAKRVNREFKNKERDRRDVRMAAMVKAGSLPYTPDVMSWLSQKLDKRSSKITDADIKTLLAS